MNPWGFISDVIPIVYVSNVKTVPSFNAANNPKAGSSPDKNPEANIALLLQNLGDKSNRKAQFRTIIALIIDGEEHLFEGIVKGQITFEKTGSGGFGYDPVFQPDGYKDTFAVLPASIKNEISHRSRALQKMVAFLEQRKLTNL